MPRPSKDWKDFPDTSTPITAAALEDLEDRAFTYTEDEVAPKANTADLGTAAGADTGDFDAAGAAASAQAASQPLDSDLTSIAGLSPTNDDVVQRKAGAWVNRTPAQLKSDLSLAKGDVGLGNVDNTSDANKPVSTAQQTALDLKANTASLGTAAPLNVPASGNAASGEVVKGSDTRLSDTRTPTDATVSIAKLASGVLDTDGTFAANSDSKLASQKAVKTAIDAEAAARAAALGLPLGLTGATQATRYVGATTSGAPASGTFAIGDFVIDRANGYIWICTTAGSPGTWARVGAGTELPGTPYAEITTNSPAVSTNYPTRTDVAGLSVTVTVAARPIKVIFDCAAFGNSSTGGGVLSIMEGSTELTFCAENLGSGLTIPVHREVRLTPSAGSHTYKIAISRLSAAGTVSITAAGCPAFIQAIEC